MQMTRFSSGLLCQMQQMEKGVSRPQVTHLYNGRLSSFHPYRVLYYYCSLPHSLSPCSSRHSRRVKATRPEGDIKDMHAHTGTVARAHSPARTCPPHVQTFSIYRFLIGPLEERQTATQDGVVVAVEPPSVWSRGSCLICHEIICLRVMRDQVLIPSH